MAKRSEHVQYCQITFKTSPHALQAQVNRVCHFRKSDAPLASFKFKFIVTVEGVQCHLATIK